MPTRQALGLVGILTGLLAACQPAEPGQKEAEQAIVAQERRALEQWSTGNPLGYLDVDADDVTYFDDIGAHSRVDGIAAMRTYLTSLQGKIPPHRYEMLDPKVQLYGDIGILTLRYEAYGTAAEPLSRWKATSVYRRADDQWRIVHAHWSLVKERGSSGSSGP
jgi:ketosteroid isomerase-like protein